MLGSSPERILRSRGESIITEPADAARSTPAGKPASGPGEGIVFVVDDDAAVRASLARSFALVGLACETFESATAFFDRPLHPGPSCLVLDVNLPDLNGLEVQECLSEAGRDPSIVFISGFGDIPTSVRAMKQGALDFLPKPFLLQDLYEAVRRALERDRAAVARRDQVRSVRERFETLSPRERQVFTMVVGGLLNKQIAGRLGTREKTIKAQRSRVMAKMQARSLADLVHLAERLGGEASAEAV